MTIEKVYDELYGMIDDLKKQIAAGSGSDVSITPALESGTKVADYEIDGEAGVLYAPTPAIVPELVIDTTEHIVGKYGNDDMYCKEVTIDAFPSTAYTPSNYAHGITDLKEFVAFNCYITSSGIGASGYVPYMGATAGGADNSSMYAVNLNDTNIIITVGRDRSAVSGKIILFYTKTEPETVPDEDLTPETRTTKRAKK